ncbi:YitT family protein [Numidum massiliense]|uniref:YitT family protein n=1 Tax=Numidum massiliense TaxID=1522315 RepID=UPI0036F3B122
MNVLRRAVCIVFGAMLMAVALEIFLVPNRVIDGGITGIAIILSHILQIKLGLLLFVLNFPFFFLGYKQIGKTFTISAVFGVVIMSIGTVQLHDIKPLTDDPLLAAVFGGITLGIGVGLVIKNGGSLDGTEIMAILFNKKLPFSVGEVIMFFNIFILGSAGFVFGWNHAMYSLIAYFIAYKMMDIVIEGFDSTKSVWIISDRHQEIGEALLHRLGRGVTYLNGEGGYTGDEKKMIFCVVTRLEEAKLKAIVDEFDSQAFLAIGDIHDVKGGQFKKRDIH